MPLAFVVMGTFSTPQGRVKYFKSTISPGSFVGREDSNQPR